MRNVATKLLNSMLFLDIANGDVISAFLYFGSVMVCRHKPHLDWTTQLEVQLHITKFFCPAT